MSVDGLSEGKKAWWRPASGSLRTFGSLAILAGTAACGLGITAASGADLSPSGYAADAGARADSGAAGPTTTRQPGSGAGDAGGALLTDAVQTMGSPLCNVGPASVCDPDDAGCSTACTEQVLGATAAANAKGECVEGHGLPCRVTSVHGDGGVPMVVPVCSALLPHAGVAEDPCQSSGDCSVGFECVVDDANPDAGSAGLCRHYCCSNVCADPASYCDIETAVGGAVAVPVCVPQKAPCTLLKDTCPTGLACQIVDQSTGLATCDKPGSATAGQSCETEKCAKGFSCIGQFPSRLCAQLCDVDQPNYCVNGTCTQNSALASNDSGVGVCAQ